MSRDNRPTLEELSLYYDGLLEGDARERVETFLASAAPDDRLLLDWLATFDCVLQANSLPDAEVDRLLADNLTEIHRRIYRTESRRSDSWRYLLTPRFILSALGVFLLLAVTVSLFEGPGAPVSRPAVAVAPTPAPETPAEVNRPLPTPVVATESQPPKVAQAPEPEPQPQVSEAQKQLILAMAKYASGAVSTGVEKVSTQTKEISTSLSEDLNVSERRTVDTLAQLGQKQIAYGLGASMISMMLVF